MTTNERHVIPVDDLVAHEEHRDCVCAPAVEPVMRDDGSGGWIYIHHSLDGREPEEQP